MKKFVDFVKGDFNDKKTYTTPWKVKLEEMSSDLRWLNEQWDVEIQESSSVSIIEDDCTVF